MKEWMNRILEFARSHIAAQDRSNASEEESWLGI